MELSESEKAVKSNHLADRREERHPKDWVVRMVQGRRLAVPDKTLYWWSVHLERFLKFCRGAGPESSEIPEVAARVFLESLPIGTSAQEFAREQARMALEVFLSEVEGWSWGQDRFGRVEPKFRLRATRTGLTTEVLVSTNREESSDQENAVVRDRESWEAMRRALRVRHYALRTEELYLHWVGRFLGWLERCGGDLEAAVRAFLEELAVGDRVLSFKN